MHKDLFVNCRAEAIETAICALAVFELNLYSHQRKIYSRSHVKQKDDKFLYFIAPCKCLRFCSSGSFGVQSLLERFS